VSRADALVLPANVDAAAVAALWRTLAGAAPASIDFAAVREIDSAGLAFVVACSGLAAVSAPPKLLNVPERFVQLCRAHRIERELLQ
jgi:ABC-type transporter Mla MlaB component